MHQIGDGDRFRGATECRRDPSLVPSSRFGICERSRFNTDSLTAAGRHGDLLRCNLDNSAHRS